MLHLPILPTGHYRDYICSASLDGKGGRRNRESRKEKRGEEKEGGRKMSVSAEVDWLACSRGVVS